MTLRTSAVTIKQLPETMSTKERRIFFREIESCMSLDRPSIVLDCSKVRRLDRSVVHLLLCCLEEAMKRNGDVKLAAMPPGAGTILEMTGINRLFDIFDTTADAVNSFNRLPVNAISEALLAERSPRESESAA
jgi:anti-sigma B factor antagonist